uniref:Uncharacterized protein n=1 Tax=viral metagenome TaxID=1070528 RepID=A0A6C0E3M3_9ZZZZ
MGNITLSSVNKPHISELSDYIDKLASEYILNMDIKNLSRMSNKQYCDKLVVLTGDILSNKFDHAEITMLKKRTDGTYDKETTKEKVFFLDSEKLNDLDKTSMCRDIAKFYVKIAHLYAAIISTINPVYEYEEGGQLKTATLMDKNEIPKNAIITKYDLNICNRRIKALQSYKVGVQKDVSIQPAVCDMDRETLDKEPGIPELKMLYYDNNYNFETGEFGEMSEETAARFKEDLKRFYTTFTGETEIPEGINDFSSVKLRYYRDCCANEIHIKEDDDLFVLYAKHLNQMISISKVNQNKLIQILDSLLVSENGVMRVNSGISETEIQELIQNARALIIDLYINCEEDYVKGMKIYESIVEHNILHTTERQIEMLKNQATQLIKSTQEAFF